MRRGRLRVATPLVYTASTHGPAGVDHSARSETGHFHLAFATVIHVTGTRPHVLRDLRLELMEPSSNTTTTLDWAGWEDDADRDGLKQPFVVAPDAPSERHLRFVQHGYANQFDGRMADTLEARIVYVGDDEVWRELGRFRLFRDSDAWAAGVAQVNSRSGQAGSPYDPLGA